MAKKKGLLDRLADNDDMQFIANFTNSDNIQNWIMGMEENEGEEDKLGKMKE